MFRVCPPFHILVFVSRHFAKAFIWHIQLLRVKTYILCFCLMVLFEHAIYRNAKRIAFRERDGQESECGLMLAKNKQHKSNLCHPSRSTSHHIWWTVVDGRMVNSNTVQMGSMLRPMFAHFIYLLFGRTELTEIGMIRRRQEGHMWETAYNCLEWKHVFKRQFYCGIAIICFFCHRSILIPNHILAALTLKLSRPENAICTFASRRNVLYDLGKS